METGFSMNICECECKSEPIKQPTRLIETLQETVDCLVALPKPHFTEIKAQGPDDCYGFGKEPVGETARSREVCSHHRRSQ